MALAARTKVHAALVREKLVVARDRYRIATPSLESALACAYAVQTGFPQNGAPHDALERAVLGAIDFLGEANSANDQQPIDALESVKAALLFGERVADRTHLGPCAIRSYAEHGVVIDVDLSAVAIDDPISHGVKAFRSSLTQKELSYLLANQRRADQTTKAADFASFHVAALVTELGDVLRAELQLIFVATAARRTLFEKARRFVQALNQYFSRHGVRISSQRANWSYAASVATVTRAYFNDAHSNIHPGNSFQLFIDRVEEAEGSYGFTIEPEDVIDRRDPRRQSEAWTQFKERRFGVAAAHVCYAAGRPRAKTQGPPELLRNTERGELETPFARVRAPDDWRVWPKGRFGPCVDLAFVELIPDSAGKPHRGRNDVVNRRSNIIPIRAPDAKGGGLIQPGQPAHSLGRKGVLDLKLALPNAVGEMILPNGQVLPVGNAYLFTSDTNWERFKGNSGGPIVADGPAGDPQICGVLIGIEKRSKLTGRSASLVLTVGAVELVDFAHRSMVAALDGAAQPEDL